MLLNCVKHSGVKSAKVTVSLRRSNVVNVLVADKGRGFDPSILKSQNTQSTGLGLFSIAERLEQVTDGTFSVGPGSLFPCLHRLEGEGLVRSEWSTDDRGRRIKTYALTAAGRKRLAAERKNWERIVRAVAQVLGEA